MHFLQFVSLLTIAVCGVWATSDSLTNAVTWDQYSLLVNGERVFIFSGEFHYARLPVPALWRDVLEKFKANGLNAISCYFFWSYHSAANGKFDFSSPGKDIQYLFDLANEIGLYVIARPGPYSNAETNGGGLALWGSDGSLGSLRTNDPTYYRAWLPWMNALNQIIAKNQVTNGGPVVLYQVENELQELVHQADNSLVLYMEQIEAAARDAGIVVPTSSNEKGMRSQSWSTDYENVGGAVNVYGLDSYPGGFSCTNVNSGFNLVRTYYQWFSNYSYTQPEFFPEFEGGYFQPWGGYFYDQCLAEHDPAYADVYYKNNIGQRTTLMNLYMAFGGTNWGNLGAPVVYTSYDYSAPLRETREVQLKFKQTKLIALFTRVSPDLLKTIMESNGTGNAVSSAAVFSWVLRNPDTGAGFYTLAQTTSSSRASTTFSVNVNTSIGTITVPNVTLNGRQSKIVVTDYAISKHILLYSSAEVLTQARFNGPVLVMYLQAGQQGEFAFAGDVGSRGPVTYGSATVTRVAARSSSTPYFKYTYMQTAGTTVLQFPGGLLVYLLDTETAWNFFAPSTTTNPNVGLTQQVFAIGPYNVRSATMAGNIVQLVGDNANVTDLEVMADSSATTIQWNGQLLSTQRTPYGSLKAIAPGAQNRTITLPNLSWQVADSLPERLRTYDDSKWTVCNKTTSSSPVAPLTLPVLFSSDYGFYAGTKIYRGHFNSAGATSVALTVQGGTASGWTAWLNGVYVGGNTGNASASSSSATLNLSGVQQYAAGNVLTVVTDYTGHDETSARPAGLENPRGLLGATLYGASFNTWKIQGCAGGSQANIDLVRGPMNEDGLYGTRVGWHLPGFEAQNGATWSASSPLIGLNNSGIAYYVSDFELNLDPDLDVPLGIELGAPSGTLASVQVYINGYQYAKYIPQIGPQTRFPFPPGVINNRGSNHIAISLWSQTDAGARLSTAQLFSYGQYQTGFKFNQDWSALQPQYSTTRSQYA